VIVKRATASLSIIAVTILSACSVSAASRCAVGSTNLETRALMTANAPTMLYAAMRYALRPSLLHSDARRLYGRTVGAVA
jgi:hypothetical protein